ncbi:hypothetical protein [Flavisolibacter ginsenosidimutans]|uniref:Uncharacterized protein n=1 Tax=Flavisolibacter ginsenosidimutans TaxID=661481 RepID=A0A5B8UPI1_9BACT|nr:hypothetical protein [Flavisolibacter ginsenosidimutans]QEC58356.1 hypothetical protein FSB75_21425 [Flavisolibacter ginsenosidimutans]
MQNKTAGLHRAAKTVFKHLANDNIRNFNNTNDTASMQKSSAQASALLTLLFALTALSTFAQKIVYSEVDEDDSRRMRFEVMGKISGNFLVYKNSKSKNYVSVFNNNMEQIAKVEQDYIPDDKLINIDFFPYNDFTYLVYQYQKKKVVYCEAVKVDGMGKRISDVMTLDTAHIGGFGSNNKVYTAISSEDKSKLVLFKINSRNKEHYLITTLLFDSNLSQMKRSQFTMDMEEDKDYLDEFNVDNDGDLVFAKGKRANNEVIQSSSIFYKAAQSDSLISVNTQPEKIFLDEIHIKVDNVNKRYFLTSFYYAKKRGDIEGFYFYVWDKATKMPVLQNSLALGEELRREAKSDNSNVKTAFNDYFIRSIVIKRDGGFLINTESYYTISRGNPWNRFNYLYGMPLTTYDYYSLYSPYYSSWYWRDRYNTRQNVRYNADNITILSFNNDGKLQWNSVIHKEQFDDESEDRISFQTVNTGGQIHYLFNVDERRALLLNDFTLSPGGEIVRNPTLKNLDRGYEFMPKYSKQVSSYQLIVPCYYRNNNICFAKVEFN